MTNKRMRPGAAWAVVTLLGSVGMNMAAAQGLLPAPGIRVDVASTEREIQAAQAQRLTAEEALTTMQKLVSQGQAPQSDLANAQANVQKWNGVVGELGVK